MAKVHKITRRKDTTNYEVNSYWWHSDVTTKTWFDILSDYRTEDIVSMIQNPMNDYNNKELRIISRRLYSSDGILRNTLDYMKALPSLDYVITNYITDKSSKIQKEIMNYTMRKIKHKQLIRDIILKAVLMELLFII